MICAKKFPRTGSATGFYRHDGARHGTTNVRRSYLLDEDVRLFDAAGFSISPNEAEAIDPQQCLLLKTVYEAIGAGGHTAKVYGDLSLRFTTGTQAGDPREAAVIYESFGRENHAASSTPLYVGSIKTVVGHLEGAVGLAGFLKASSSLQKGLIPLNLSFNRLNPEIEPFYKGLQVLAYRLRGMNAPPAKLKCIHPFAEPEYDVRVGLINPMGFLTPPNLKELSVTNVVAVDDGCTRIPFTWDCTGRDSPLRNIDSSAFCIDGPSLSLRFAHAPRLRSFTYSHQTKWHRCEYDWGCWGLLRRNGALRRSVKPSRHLAVITEERLGALITGVTSLRGFACLELLTSDVRSILCSLSLESGERMGEYDEHEPLLGFKPWSVEAILPLRL
ncbi:hypothetical protein DL771_002579 [Monosporascus sp. 5C6A]|nr:hypothetical protein DL771_002579 [Monosporascus sp. 5C6A]